MNAIVAVSLDWGIGRGNQLLFHIREDMQRFRAMTGGGAVIMGRRTLDSMPGGKPLPQRRNIVITRDPSFTREGVEAAHSVQQALDLAAAEDPERVWVIGGGEIYRAMLPLCSRCYVTRVYAQPDCDIFFPNLDTMANWKILRSEPVLRAGELDYQFVDYVNRDLL